MIWVPYVSNTKSSTFSNFLPSQMNDSLNFLSSFPLCSHAFLTPGNETCLPSDRKRVCEACFFYHAGDELLRTYLCIYLYGDEADAERGGDF